ncbi:hypothetical protein W97_04207 [Coniosporium apollinis CBS 100218]|uniref:AAA+ ATPase domain-containing protein n=1 Tax=Coniosporium apollinis (strain CBS 100218) TaxID=1168221 RepID=R7YSR7_CONA1|nr:uncharacterized protein W97_04207 [Coniosporium apollinis CBS 100218]EON64972.1 hypothetical protein W97_04207 [Coniosporium apollinis CBS 100218]
MAASATKIKPALHVEVRLKSTIGTFVRTDLVREEVSEWLCTRFVHLKLKQQVTDYEGLSLGNYIESIDVVDFSGDQADTSSHRLEDVQLDVQAYELHSSSDDGSPRTVVPSVESDEADPSPQIRVTPLPSKSLNGVWNALIFDEAIPAKLLHFLTRMISLTKHPSLNLTILNWNRLLLLHGPPGSGKTTLCRALAQKLTIRLGRQFTHGKLVEINSNSLHSKWFGESGKLVRKLFDSVHAMADDETTLICVLIDEVETLTGSREKSATGNECGDALRATNQLLTALDRLRHRPNIMVFCTSNLVTAIDQAFLDRVDIKQYIPNPPPRAIYEILRSSLNELIRCDLLIPTDDPDDASDGASSDSVSLVQAGSDWEVLVLGSFPSFAEMNVHLWNRPNAPARKLWKLAQRCEGFSGRALRRLPFLALAMHTYSDPCPVPEALAALSLAVDEHAGRIVKNDEPSHQPELIESGL